MTYAQARGSAVVVMDFRRDAAAQQQGLAGHRKRVMASLEALHWQVRILETLAARRPGDDQDGYRLFDLRVALSDALWKECRWEEGAGEAEQACVLARTWNDVRREARALNVLGLNLLAGAQLSEAEVALVQALAIRERSLGPDHPDTAKIMGSSCGICTVIPRPPI